jgi:hypothetical protein
MQMELSLTLFHEYAEFSLHDMAFAHRLMRRQEGYVNVGAKPKVWRYSEYMPDLEVGDGHSCLVAVPDRWDLVQGCIRHAEFAISAAPL